jgi:thiamine-monophosphate kinase
MDAPALVERYRNPRPRLEAGERLAPLVNAMMDVSDGLLIDAARMAEASGCAAEIRLDGVPLSEPYLASRGEARLEAATAGDDYELLFAADPARAPAILALAEELGLPLSPIGAFAAGAGLSLTEDGTPVPLPARLGFEHG